MRQEKEEQLWEVTNKIWKINDMPICEKCKNPKYDNHQPRKQEKEKN